MGLREIFDQFVKTYELLMRFNSSTKPQIESEIIVYIGCIRFLEKERFQKTKG